MNKLFSTLILALALVAGAFGQVVGGGSVVSGGSVKQVPAGSSPTGGPGLSTDYALAAWNGTGGNLLRNSVLITDANGDLIMPSTATNGFQIFNTVDQVTNFEKLQFFWNSNVADIRFSQGGTGAGRTFQIESLISGSNVVFALNNANSAGRSWIAGSSYSQPGTLFIVGNAATYTNTSGTVNFMQITPTYNQASGAGVNTDLLTNRTQTAVGSGVQRLIDMQVGSTTWYSFAVGNAATTGAFNSSSLVETAVQFAPNFTSQTGSAGWNAFLVNVTAAGSGSGVKKLLDFQVGGSSKVSVDSGGSLTMTGRQITTPSALTYASPTSVDVTLASCYTVTTVNATGSVTFNATAGGTAGQDMTILITNDATSAKTITFGTNFLSTGTLTAGAVSRHTSITFKSDGTSWYETGRAVLLN